MYLRRDTAMRYSRQNKILEIIKEHEIETQDQLQAALKEVGFNVTQATVSRDITELQRVKSVSRSGRSRYVSAKFETSPITDRFVKIFRETTISFASAQNLIILKTLSGCGNAAAEAFDNLGLDHIVGSVSGDNTMLIVVDKEENVKPILDRIDRIINKVE